MTTPEGQPTAGRMQGREHQLPVRVYYEDTDFTGLVYHGAYVRFFERGRSDFLRLIGIGHSSLLDRTQPIAFAVTRLEIAFRQAARIDDALLVHTNFDAARGPRLFISQRITRDGALIASAQVEVACIDLQGRARRPPQVLIAALGSLFTNSP